MSTMASKTMTGRWFGWTAIVPALALLIWAMPANAQVHDNARLFSETAVRMANDDIAQMKSRAGGHTMLIETYASVPADKQEALNRDKNAFFQQWASDRGKAERVSGVVMLICLDPKRYEIALGNKTVQSGLFTNADRQALGIKVRQALSTGNYDEALTISTSTVLERYAAHKSAGQGGSAYSPVPVESSGNPAPSATPTPAKPAPTAKPGMSLGSMLLIGAIILVVVSFIFRMLRRMSSAQSGYDPNYGPGYGGGGGGFGTGLLGGILGGVAGSWMANSAFANTRNDTQAQDPNSAGAGGIFGPDASSSSDPDTSFSDIGGGDFGGDSGGGDSGGGDF